MSSDAPDLPARVAISRLIVLLSDLQPLYDQFNIGPRCPDSTRGLLLECVQYVHNLAEAHRIDRPIGVAVMVLDDLKYARTLAFPRLRLRVLAAKLCKAKCVAQFVLH